MCWKSCSSNFSTRLLYFVQWNESFCPCRIAVLYFVQQESSVFGEYGDKTVTCEWSCCTECNQTGANWEHVSFLLHEIQQPLSQLLSICSLCTTNRCVNGYYLHYLSNYCKRKLCWGMQKSLKQNKSGWLAATFVVASIQLFRVLDSARFANNRDLDVSRIIELVLDFLRNVAC
jgi:hypothetical protein